MNECMFAVRCVWQIVVWKLCSEVCNFINEDCAKSSAVRVDEGGGRRRTQGGREMFKEHARVRRM